jgi:hypothetical protein
MAEFDWEELKARDISRGRTIRPTLVFYSIKKEGAS